MYTVCPVVLSLVEFGRHFWREIASVGLFALKTFSAWKIGRRNKIEQVSSEEQWRTQGSPTSEPQSLRNRAASKARRSCASCFPPHAPRVSERSSPELYVKSSPTPRPVPSLASLSSTKPVRGAKKFGDRCFRASE